MKPSLVDTDILSLFLRGVPQVVAAFDRYLSAYAKVNLSIISYYEILSGLAHRDAHRQREKFLQFVVENTVVPLTERACDHAAAIYAAVRKAGQPVDDIDILIAGIAVAHDLVIVMHNQQHFLHMPNVTIEDWSSAE